MKYYNVYFIMILVLITVSCNDKVLEIDPDLLAKKIYEPTTTKHQKLKETTVLYLDHSTCVIDAAKNSNVFKTLRPNLGQYCDTLVLIKGQNFDTIPLNRKDNKIAATLEKIKDDIPYADIRKVVFDICNGNQQAILISDCEAYDKNKRVLDLEPYMSEPFKVWLKRGYSIYILVEPYKEQYRGKMYDKKRFYIFFTDDKLHAPIINAVMPEIKQLVDAGECTLFKITNNDIKVNVPKDNFVNKTLSFEVKNIEDCKIIEIYDEWEVIREYIMKIDEYGNPLPEEKPEFLIGNIEFNEGNNYKITDIKVQAHNITKKYLALEDKSIKAEEIDISEAFVIDPKAFKNNKLNVLLTEKIFTDGYLFDKKEYGGNIIRLDFVIEQIEIKPYNSSDFEWKSLYSPETAICVSKSIDNALKDIEVVPTTNTRKIIHTVFLKTQ